MSSRTWITQDALLDSSVEMTSVPSGPSILGLYFFGESVGVGSWWAEGEEERKTLKQTPHPARSLVWGSISPP